MGINPVCDAIIAFIENRGSLSENNFVHLERHLPAGTGETGVTEALNTLMRVGHVVISIKNGQVHFCRS